MYCSRVKTILYTGGFGYANFFFRVNHHETEDSTSITTKTGKRTKVKTYKWSNWDRRKKAIACCINLRRVIVLSHILFFIARCIHSISYCDLKKKLKPCIVRFNGIIVFRDLLLVHLAEEI